MDNKDEGGYKIPDELAPIFFEYIGTMDELRVQVATLKVELDAALKSAAAWKRATKLGRHILHLNVLRFGANGQSVNTVLGSFSDARRTTRKLSQKAARFNHDQNPLP